MLDKDNKPLPTHSLLHPTSAVDHSHRWVYIALIVAITVAGAGLRIARLDHPMRGDEAFNFLRFVAGAGPASWLNYESPNNHLLNTLAEVVSTRLLGPGPVAIRLPALLAGVLLIPAGASLARRLFGRFSAGIIAAILISSSSILIEYSINARGYSLVCLATVAMAYFTVGIFENPSQIKQWLGWSAAGVIGLWAVPVMLYPIGLLVCLIIGQLLVVRPAAADVKAMLRRLTLSLAGIGLVSLLLYLPSIYISGGDAIFANRFVSPLSFKQVLADLLPEASKTISHWLRDTSIIWQAIVVAGLARCLLAFARRRNTMYLLPVLGPALLLLGAVAHRVVPFPRVWLFLLPMLLVCAAGGLSEIIYQFAGSSQTKRKIAIAALLVIVVAAAASSAIMTMKRQYLISEDPKTFVDAEPIIDDAAALSDGKTAVIWNLHDPHWPPLAYYLAVKSNQSPGFGDTRFRYDRAVVIVEPAGDIESVFKANPGNYKRTGKVELYKRYPSGATVFLAGLRPPSGNE